MVKLYTHPRIRLRGVVIIKLSTGTTLRYFTSTCMCSSLSKYKAESLLLNDCSVFTLFQQSHHCPKTSSYWQVEMLPVGFGRIDSTLKSSGAQFNWEVNNSVKQRVYLSPFYSVQNNTTQWKGFVL
jgi:hypothetical protein